MTEPAIPPNPGDLPPATTGQLLVRGLEVRLRFLLMLAALAGLMAGWPWVRAGWDRIASWRYSSPQAAVSSDTEFFCPMDPGIISAWPAICPICNMDLITRKKSDAALLPEGVVSRMQFSPYRIQLAGIRTTPVEARGDAAAPAQEGKRLFVPVSAVVYQGPDSIVYVESMPGMFDGVKVELGSVEGESYPVLAGLQAGQRVALAGAFLIDAESRLHTNVATQYFGAGSSSRQPEPPRRTEPPRRRAEPRKSADPLSEADLALVQKQKICPVTEAPLGSMGTPVATMVQGRKVFLCCRGCESGLLANPEKFLARLKPNGDGDPK